MDIVGFTFDGEMKEYVTIKAIKISKWIDPKDLSMEAVFRLTIEHNLEKDGFKKLREFYVYFKREDLDNITIKKDVTDQMKEKKKETLNYKNRRKGLEERISPLGGSIPSRLKISG